MAYHWLERTLGVAAHAQCRGIDWEALDGWLTAAWRNPLFANDPHRRQDLLSLSGQLHLLRGDGAGALTDFNGALMQDPTPTVAAMQTALLASAGHYREALAHLDAFERVPQPTPSGWGMPRVHAWVLERQGYWPHELGELRRKLLVELATPGSPE